MIGVPGFYAAIDGGSESPATARPAAGWAVIRSGMGLHACELEAASPAHPQSRRAGRSHQVGLADIASPAAARHGVESRGRFSRKEAASTTRSRPTSSGSATGFGRRFLGCLPGDRGRREFGFPSSRVLVPGLNHPSGQMMTEGLRNELADRAAVFVGPTLPHHIRIEDRRLPI